ncbi:MAG: LacI family DNA-binding transcriptional regulator [Victivallaceae bacterium]
MENVKTVKPVSRRDVAKASGVSLTTVTHALNPTPGTRVNEATRARVMKVATELGYRPNFIGRALVTGKSFSIGLMQPQYESIFSDFYQRMSYGLAISMGHDDYNLLLTFRDGQNGFLKTIRQGRVDGMVVLQSDFDTKYIDQTIAKGLPTVVLNRTYDIDETTRGGNVSSDHFELVTALMEKFTASDCKNILTVIDQTYCEPNLQLFDAARRIAVTLAKSGIATENLTPSQTDFEAQIRNAFASGRRWDAIYIDGVEFVMPLVKAAAEFGFIPGRDFELQLSDAPRDLSSRNLDFPITIYFQQPEKMGEAAWKMLKGLIAGEDIVRRMLVPYKKVDL